MPPRSQPTSGDPGKAPRRRSIPAIARSERRVVTFEPRLALSASPGADLLLDAWGALHSHDFDAVSAESFCRPASGPAIPLSSQLWPAPQATGSDSSVPADDSSPLPPLIAQAAAVRSSYELTGAGQTVAVIDSGIAWDHVALGQGFGPGYRVVGGWDFAEADANPYDDAPAGFHGTHVAGLIGGQSASLSGIAPGADLVALRVFDDAGQGSLDWIESALQWVHDNRHAFDSPITTVNISLGALLPEGLAAEIQAQLEDELQQLRDDAIVVVAAAGNAFDAAFSERLAYPASSPHTWAVGSVDADGGLSQFSQRGEAILATVGRGVDSSVPDHVLGWDGEVNDYHAANGTSMAAPQVAAASMLLRQAIEQTGRTATLDELLERLQQTSERRVDPVSGVTYYQPNLSAAIASVLGEPADAQHPDGASPAPRPVPAEPEPTEPTPTPAAPLEPILVDLGRVQWSEVDLTPAATLQATAVRSGWFSVAMEADAEHPAVHISDAVGNILWDGVPPPSGQIDIPVVAEQSLRISLANATSGPTPVWLANVLGLDQGQLDLTTGVGDPDVAIDLREGVVAQIGSLRYVFAAGQVTSGVIDGGSGADRLQITSSAAAARLVLNPYAESTLSEGGVSFALRSFEDVRFDGGGGADRAYLYDTRGNDRLEASPGAATLEGAGFRYQVSAVQRVYVHATAGGSDMAFLQDSAQDDRLAVRPQFVSLRGGDFFNSANGFERVYAYATSGGDDVAELYDSAGDDRMTASAESAWISGPGYYVQARNFDSVTGHATAGGNDLATLYAESSSAGRWHHSSDQTALRTDEGASRAARGFERVETYEAGAPVRSLGGLLAAGETALEGTAADEREAETPENISSGWAGRSLLSHAGQGWARGVEDWRLRELLEAAAPLAAASIESSVASIAIPTSGGEAAERRLLEALFEEFSSEFDDAFDDETTG